MISSPVRFLFSLIGINLVILLVNLQYKTFVKRELPAIDALTPIIDDYRFTDTSLAYKALTQLDIYKPIPMRQKIPTSHLGLKMDDHYCAKQRAYFVEYPEEAFEQMNLLHSWPTNTFVADTFATVANDLHGAINRKLTFKQKEEFLYEIKPETTCFFTTNILALYFNLTKHASCLFQASNQIPGQTTLALKDIVAREATSYVKRYEDRPHCINHDKFFPESWLLSDPNECKDFFKKLLSPEYAKLKEERKIVYIKKIVGTHRGEGIQPLNTPEELKVREQYKDGLLCGSIRNVTLMQHYIHNALLLHGHKFDFRMYLLIASTNPLIAYYHDGFLRVTLAEYDVESDDKKVLLTNLALNQQIYDNVSKGVLYQGKTEEQLKNDQQWSFDRLQSYLLISGVIQDPNWLDNYLRPELKKAMIHLVRLSSFNYAKHSSFYGLYGVDFMLDKDLNLWFIEANSGPAFDGYSQPMAKFISKMLTDHLEIVYGLLRSRMKRTISFINKLIADGTVSRKEEKGIEFKDFERNLKEFEYITMNYFEDEFKVGEDNGFSKIIDENEHGIDVYQRLIPADCL